MRFAVPDQNIAYRRSSARNEWANQKGAKQRGGFNMKPFIALIAARRCWPSRAALLTGYYAQAVRRDTVPGIKSDDSRTGRGKAQRILEGAADRAESKNLATEMPEKVRELDARWTQQAQEYYALARKDLIP
jgi:hypothetical protein